MENGFLDDHWFSTGTDVLDIVEGIQGAFPEQEGYRALSKHALLILMQVISKLSPKGL